jgi:hypothetical protein
MRSEPNMQRHGERLHSPRLDESHSVIRRRLVAIGIASCAVAVVALVGCGSSNPSVTQLRETVHRYLDAASPEARCQLFTTVYRTENPNVVLLGGCQQSEEISPAQEAARQRLRITEVNVQGDQATVTVASIPGGPSPGLTGLLLEIEGGQWRINGFTDSAPVLATAG